MKFLVEQALGHDGMGDGGDDGHVGARRQGQVVGRPDVGGVVHQIDAARVDHDQLGPGAQAFLQARRKDRVAVGRVRADQDDDIGLFDRVEILRAGEVPKV